MSQGRRDFATLNHSVTWAPCRRLDYTSLGRAFGVFGKRVAMRQVDTRIKNKKCRITLAQAWQGGCHGFGQKTISNCHSGPTKGNGFLWIYMRAHFPLMRNRFRLGQTPNDLQPTKDYSILSYDLISLFQGKQSWK